MSNRNSLGESHLQYDQFINHLFFFFEGITLIQSYLRDNRSLEVPSTAGRIITGPPVITEYLSLVILQLQLVADVMQSLSLLIAIDDEDVRLRSGFEMLTTLTNFFAEMNFR